MANTLNTINAITNAVAKTRNPNLWMDGNVVFRLMPRDVTDAGLKIQVPVRHAQHPVEGYVGLEGHNPTRQEWQRTAYFPWVQSRVGKTYARIDILKNSGNRQAVINYVKSLEMNADESFADYFAKQFLGTANDSAVSPKLVNSFKHICNSTAAYGGANPFGTGYDFGDLDKSTVVDADGNTVWSGRTMNLGGTGHGFTRSNFIRAMGTVKNGNRRPDIVAMHERLLAEVVVQSAAGGTPLQRYVDTRKLFIGFETYEIMGIPMYGDRRIPFSTTTAATNMVYFINTMTTKFAVHRDCNMLREPYVKLQKEDGYLGFNLLTGNFVCDSPADNLIMHNADYNSSTD